MAIMFFDEPRIAADLIQKEDKMRQSWANLSTAWVMTNYHRLGSLNKSVTYLILAQVKPLLAT